MDKCSGKVVLFMMNGTGSIWNFRDWLRARRLRITGSLIGSLANTPRQVKENGLPLLLSKNETKLLLEKELAVLCEFPSFLLQPDDKFRIEAAQNRSDSFKSQVKLLKEERKEEIKGKASMIIKGKLAKRMKMNPGLVFDEEEEAKAIIEEEFSKIPDPHPCHLFVHTPLEDPWTNEEDMEEVVYNYPRSEQERLEYSTFRSLWEAGWTVTGGGKFGANLAAYEGDIFQCHAQLLIFCTSREQKLSPRTLVSIARLAHSVKKMAVLAYFDEQEEIVFQSLDWSVD